MKKINLVVLMGGMSSEHEVSLSTGKNVAEYLNKKKYNIKPIVISKKGKWFELDNKQFSSIDIAIGKKEKGLDEECKALQKRETQILCDDWKGSADVVFNAMHGEYGEDGRIQGLLDCFGVSYTGSGILASALAMDKIRSKELFKLHGLKVPRDVILKEGDSLDNVAKNFSGTVVVKPSNLGSSVGISVVNSKDKKALKRAVDKAFERCDTVMAEECLNGKELTCGIIDNFKGQKHFALPVTEIIPPDGRFFDYEVKYDGSTQEITPARISKELTKKIQEQSIKAHKILGCKSYSRADFILKNNKELYILEVNTLPGLTSESLIPKAAREAGIEFSELLDIIIANAQGPIV